MGPSKLWGELWRIRSRHYISWPTRGQYTCHLTCLGQSEAFIFSLSQSGASILSLDQSDRRRVRSRRGCWRSRGLWPHWPGETMTTLGKIKLIKLYIGPWLSFDSNSISYNKFLEFWQTLALYKSKCHRRKLSFRESNCRSWSKPSCWSKF